MTVSPAGAVTDGPLLWYVNRGSGVVLVAVLTLSVALGVLSTARTASRTWPRFASRSLHRNVSLLSVVMLLVHVASAVVDTFVTITWADAAIPFAGTYQRFWLGLGALALDLMLVVTLTGLLRNRLPGAAWRPVHLLSYLGWAVGVVHGIGIGTDVRTTWAVTVTGVCCVVVALAVTARLVIWRHERRLSAGSV